MAKENKTKYALLGVLNIAPASGYDIKRYCDGSIGHFWNENYGHIYPVLKQMEEAGWVTKEADDTETKRPKYIYTITGSGKKELEKWLMVPPEKPKERFEFLLKLYFSESVPLDHTLQWIRDSRELCTGILDLYRNIEKDYKKKIKDNPGLKRKLYFKYATLRYGILNLKMIITWCDELIENLRTMQEEEH